LTNNPSPSLPFAKGRGILNWFPDQASSYASRIDNTFYLILWITGIVFLLFAVTLIVFLIRYRYREGRVAHFTRGSLRIEIIWTIIPAAILVFLAFYSESLWSAIKDPSKFPKNAKVIQIHPRQFEWDIIYPGPDGLFGTADDIKTTNELYLALNEPVKIDLEGQDVIHSFFVPEFRIKQDAVPGLPTSVWIVPTKLGAFDIACAELCGFGHYSMRGTVHVMPKDSIDRWLSPQTTVKKQP
jgi:cytochrome c oxidase subunit 2